MAIGVVATLVAGCVVVPYSPPAESSSTPVRLEQADRVLVTVGPRQLLEDTSDALRRRDRDIEIVDSFAFRAAVFPEGDWRLSRLLDPGRRLLLAASGADYLVVVGPVLTGLPDEHGFFYGLVIHATTESSVRRACLDSVVETLRRVHPSGRLRGALMAAEPIGSSEYALSLITE